MAAGLFAVSFLGNPAVADDVIVVGAPGGPNGAGEDASADASSPDPANRATATGGAGGSGGGAGGAAAASAVSESPSSDVLADALATGGAGGEGAPGGDAGDARAEASARSGTASVTALATATGGEVQPGAGGGGALAEATGIVAGNADARVEARAHGGGGTAPVGAHATVSSAGSGLITALAEAAGGESTSATASATSTGGGAVNATVSQRNFVESGISASAVRVENAVSASTNGGSIALVQRAIGGWVSSEGSGDAESRLSFVDRLASSLSVWLQALGGDAELGGTPGDALVAASLEHTGAAPVSLHISSNGGSGAFATSGSPATNGGAASIGPVFAGSGSGDVEIEAYAFGGQGGTDGTGNAPGADGGSVALVDAIDGSTSGSLSLLQSATAGAGGMSGVAPGRGGDATSRLDVAKSLERLEVRTEAIAGSGGAPALPDQAYGVGGTSTASTTARNDGGDVSASSLAWSGYASDGAAVASGDAMASGYVILDVEASTRAPLLGELNAPGRAHIERARGVSTGGQSVSVSATLRQGDASRASGRDGHAAELVNFVEGETSGALNLEQHAFAGAGQRGGVGRSVLERHGGLYLRLETESLSGESFAGAGVGAEASSIGSSEQGGVDVTARAYGGGAEALGGAAHATARSMGHNSASATAEAIGGDGASGAVGSIDAFAEADGRGHVEVTGIVGAGHSREGDGTEVALVNAIDGSTAGVLELRQRAQGGSSDAEGGRAESVLDRSVALPALYLESEAIGGASYAESGGPFAGGSARARSAGSNTEGHLDASALAEGGLGMRGGDAEVEVVATTTGDFHDVRIGEADERADDPTWGAHGGRSGQSGPSQGGGDAVSRSTGTAFGESAVQVYDLAVGGAAEDEIAYPVPGAVRGRGGDARSHAVASGGGYSLVQASSRARGGQGGRSFFAGLESSGGNADATSLATGRGEVYAFAEALAGDPSGREDTSTKATGLNDASASALATAEGISGDAVARAASSSGLVTRLLVATSTAVDGAATAAARVDVGDAGFQAAGALQSGAPDVRASAVLLPSKSVDTIAAADFSATPGTGAGSRLTSSFELAFDLEDELLAKDVEFLFLDPQGEGSGLESLRVTLFLDGLIVFDEDADGMEQAIAFLDGLVIRPGPLDALPGSQVVVPSLRLDLSWLSSDPDWTFDVQMRVAAQVVPEPGTALLLALGLALLCFRRMRGLA